MAQNTALSLINEVEERLGWDQSSTIEGVDIRSNTRKLKNLLNRVISTLQSLQEWPMLSAESEIVTVAVYDTGTVAVTNSVDTIVGTGTAWDLSFVERAFQVGGDEYVYRVKSVESPTALTLSRIYLGTTNATASYDIAQDRYSLPDDFDRAVDDWQSFFVPASIRYAGRGEFARRRRMRGSDILLGEPSMFTVEGLDAANIRRVVRLDPYPKFQRMYTYQYQRNHPTLENDDDRILFPQRVEDVVIDTMLDIAYRDFEDDGRMQRSIVDALTAQNRAGMRREITQDPIQITPSNARRLSELRRWGRGGMRIDYGPWFDVTGFRRIP